MTIADPGKSGKGGERMAYAKHCPFCGSTKVGLFDYPFKEHRALNGCFAYCTECGARTGNYYTVDDALKAWNERKGEQNGSSEV